MKKCKDVNNFDIKDCCDSCHDGEPWCTTMSLEDEDGNKWDVCCKALELLEEGEEDCEMP